MRLCVRRPVIWALGIIILVLMIFSANGNTLYYHTSLDEVMYENESDSSDASAENLGSSKSAQVTATVENIVSGETSIRVTLTECVVKIDGESDAASGSDAADATTYEPHGLVAYFDSADSFTVGDTIIVDGTLKCIETPDNPGEFNSWQYYRCRGIDYTLYPDDAQVLVVGSGLKTSLYKIRQSLYDAVDSVSEDENEVSLFKAMLFGDKSSLDEDLYSSFQICGIAHILAVGGLHLTIIGGIILKAVRKLIDAISKSKKKRLSSCYSKSFLDSPKFTLLISSIIADAFLLSFIIMIDGSVSAWRAYIMFTLMLIAPLIGRTYDILSGLGLAGILILITEPLYVLDSSFQLSFAAIFGVGVVFPRLKNIAEELRPRDEKGRKKDLGFVYYKIITPLLFSLSIQVAAIPVILNNFYAISLYGIFLNLMIIPFMSIVLVSIFGAAIFVALSGGALTASSGAIATANSGIIAFGRFLAGTAHYFFKILIKICDFVQGLPRRIYCSWPATCLENHCLLLNIVGRYVNSW